MAQQRPGPTGGSALHGHLARVGDLDGGWGWGAKFLDYDNDGDLDLFTVNGFISAGEGSYWYDLASWTVLGPRSGRFAPTGRRSATARSRATSRFRFWRNDGFESFAEAAAEVGLDSDRDGRGVVCFDYDNDGDLDLFVANQGQPPQLFRNRGRPDAHWLDGPAVGRSRDRK